MHYTYEYVEFEAGGDYDAFAGWVVFDPDGEPTNITYDTEDAAIEGAYDLNTAFSRGYHCAIAVQQESQH